MILGLGYKARSGKDTTADYLVNHYNFKKTAFAENLKEATRVIFGFTDEHLYGDLKEVVDPFWGKTPRWIMQTFGTEACRNNIDNQIWIKSLERKVLSEPNTNWVITDARFINEIEAVKGWGGKCVEIVRQGNPHTVSSHLSETELDGYEKFHYTLHNDIEGDLDNLYDKIDLMMGIFGTQ